MSWEVDLRLAICASCFYQSCRCNETANARAPFLRRLSNFFLLVFVVVRNDCLSDHSREPASLEGSSLFLHRGDSTPSVPAVLIGPKRLVPYQATPRSSTTGFDDWAIGAYQGCTFALCTVVRDRAGGFSEPRDQQITASGIGEGSRN